MLVSYFPGKLTDLQMDAFFFDKLPSTSQSTPKPRHETSQMNVSCPQVDPDEGLGTDHDSTSERSSSMTMSTDESQEHQISSRIDDIGKKVQDLVGKINDSRTMDQTIMDNFQDKLVEKVGEICGQMKEHMYTVYEENSHAMQATLQELTLVLESCSRLNTELHTVSEALAGLNRGLTLHRSTE
uniref:Synaptonemal complex central element protein 2 n=1 Tax=Salmo trutta TaxID=8032 RepID=A0A674EEW5_SALTR